MDYRMLITYVIVDFFCIVIVSVMYQNLTMDSGSELQVRMLKRSLGVYVLFMISGLVSLVTENLDVLYYRNVDYLANVVSLSCLDLSAFYWFINVQLIVNRKFMATRWRMITYLPMAAAVILCVSSPFTGWAFYIDQSDNYVRGPLFMIVSTIPLLYDIVSSTTAYYRGFREKQASARRQYFTIGSFIFFPLTASVLQIWLAGMPILAPAIATSYFIVFISMQKDMIYNDTLTGLYNRRRAMLYMEEKQPGVSAENPLTVFMIDGNKFKMINDTYGHMEGDAAIVSIGEAVANICNRYRLFGARYGGDEFLMIKTGECPFDKDGIGTELNEELAEICKKKEKKYRLTVTTGYYTSLHSSETTDMMIKRADEDLYRKKKNR